MDTLISEISNLTSAVNEMKKSKDGAADLESISKDFTTKQAIFFDAMERSSLSDVLTVDGAQFLVDGVMTDVKEMLLSLTDRIENSDSVENIPAVTVHSSSAASPAKINIKKSGAKYVDDSGFEYIINKKIWRPENAQVVDLTKKKKEEGGVRTLDKLYFLYNFRNLFQTIL